MHRMEYYFCILCDRRNEKKLKKNEKKNLSTNEMTTTLTVWRNVILMAFHQSVRVFIGCRRECKHELITHRRKTWIFCSCTQIHHVPEYFTCPECGMVLQQCTILHKRSVQNEQLKRTVEERLQQQKEEWTYVRRKEKRNEQRE